MSSQVPIASSLVLVSLSLCAPSAFAQDQDPPPGREDLAQVEYMGRAFVFEADLAHARAAGWLSDDEPDEAVLERTAAALLQRIRRTGRFVEAQVLDEGQGRFAVVFVGKQDPRIEQFLIDGLSPAGRLAFRALAHEEDLEGTTLADERTRLEAWRAAHPERPLAFFHALARDAGGPHPALDWCLAPGASLAGGDAIALLRAPQHVVTRHDMQADIVTLQQSGTGGHHLRFLLEDEPLAALRAFGEAVRGRRLAAVVDGRAVEVFETGAPLDNPFLMRGDFPLAEARSLVFAVAGESLPVPLTFVEFAKRPLPNVVLEGE